MEIEYCAGLGALSQHLTWLLGSLGCWLDMLHVPVRVIAAPQIVPEPIELETCWHLRVSPE